MALSKEYQKCDMERIKELCSKFPEKYADLLGYVTPVIMDYFGDEYKNVVLDTLCKIDIVETNPEQGIQMSDVLESLRPDNYAVKDETFSKTALNNAAGVFNSHPIISEKNGKFSIDGEKNTICVKPMEYSYKRISFFIHELMHAIKASEHHYDIANKDGKQYLLTRTGLMQTIEQIEKNESGQIEFSSVNERNRGIEEGINTVDEYYVMKKLESIPAEEVPEEYRHVATSMMENKDPNFNIAAGYKNEAFFSDCLMKDPKLNQKIREAQFHGEYENLRDFFNEIMGTKRDNWQDVCQQIDTITTTKRELYNKLVNERAGNVETENQTISSCTEKLVGTIKKFREKTAEKDIEKDTNKEQDER